MIVPTGRMVILAAGGSILAAAGFGVGAGWTALALVNAILLGLTVLDLSLLPRRRTLRIGRTLPPKADVGASFEVVVTVEAEQPAALWLELADDVPQTFEAPDAPLVTAWHGRTAELRYTAKGRERGIFVFDQVQLRYRGMLGLWMKQVRKPLGQTIRIYPDLSAVRGLLSSIQQDMILEGKKLYRKERSGSEFHTMREYVPDDDPRSINWRASARSRTLVTNVYRPERGKFVTILIDCGRMMGVELDGKTKLDVSLEAALALAAVALRQGDKVAVIAFSSRIKAFVPAGAGLAHLQTITDAVFNLQSDFVESSYSLALQHLLKVQKKRSLTVLFSDLDNYMFEDRLLGLLQRMKRQHHLLLLGLRDEVLHGWTRVETTSKRKAYVKSVAHQLTLAREAYTARMAASGIEVIDVPVGQLAWSAVSRYLDVKAKDVL